MNGGIGQNGRRKTVRERSIPSKRKHSNYETRKGKRFNEARYYSMKPTRNPWRRDYIGWMDMIEYQELNLHHCSAIQEKREIIRGLPHSRRCFQIVMAIHYGNRNERIFVSREIDFILLLSTLSHHEMREWERERVREGMKPLALSRNIPLLH